MRRGGEGVWRNHADVVVAQGQGLEMRRELSQQRQVGQDSQALIVRDSQRDQLRQATGEIDAAAAAAAAARGGGRALVVGFHGVDAVADASEGAMAPG